MTKFVRKFALGGLALLIIVLETQFAVLPGVQIVFAAQLTILFVFLKDAVLMDIRKYVGITVVLQTVFAVAATAVKVKIRVATLRIVVTRTSLVVKREKIQHVVKKNQWLVVME